MRVVEITPNRVPASVDPSVILRAQAMAQVRPKHLRRAAGDAESVVRRVFHRTTFTGAIAQESDHTVTFLVMRQSGSLIEPRRLTDQILFRLSSRELMEGVYVTSAFRRYGKRWGQLDLPVRVFLHCLARELPLMLQDSMGTDYRYPLGPALVIPELRGSDGLAGFVDTETFLSWTDLPDYEPVLAEYGLLGRDEASAPEVPVSVHEKASGDDNQAA